MADNIKELVVISGKGGAGKTSFTAAFAKLANNEAVMTDADVDAADLNILLNGRLVKKNDFTGLPVPVIDYNKCTRCGKCSELCRFNAISDDIKIDPLVCEGCQVCYNFCPENAISLREDKMGEWFVSESPHGLLVHAKLNPGGENSGKLVSIVRQAGKKIAEETGKKLIITDGPPGVGCPVISSLTGANLVCLVIEATRSGVHDMERILELVRFFKIPAVAVINKYDLNLAVCSSLEMKLKDSDVPVIGKFPYDEVFYKSLTREKTVLDMDDGEVSPYIKDSMEKAWKRILSEITF